MQTEKEYLEERRILSLRSESNGEYSLPDYNTDVKKLLMVSAEVIPSGKFPSDDAVEYSGVISYNVIYIDSDNQVTHAEFTTDYDLSVRTDGDKYADSDICTEIVNVGMRLTGPRKFSVKTVLESDVFITESLSYLVNGDAFEDREPETLTKTVSVSSGVYMQADEREYAEEMLSVDGAIVDEIEPLLSRADVIIKSVIPSAEAVEIKGDMRIALIYKDENGEIKKCERVTPYLESVSTADSEGFSDCYASVDILSVKCTVNPTDEGVNAVVSVIAVPKVRACITNEVVLFKDAYLKECGVANEYNELKYLSNASVSSYEIAADLSVSISEMQLDDCSDVVCLKADFCAGEAQLTDDGRVRLFGQMKINGILSGENPDGGKIYLPLRYSEEIEKYVNNNCQICGNPSIECRVGVDEVKTEIANGYMNVSCNMNAAIRISEVNRERVLVSSYTTDEVFERDDSVVTVYYPDKNESLFSVAEKFHTSVERIAQDNLLTEAVFSSSSAPLSGIKKLVIR